MKSSELTIISLNKYKNKQRRKQYQHWAGHNYPISLVSITFPCCRNISRKTLFRSHFVFAIINSAFRCKEKFVQFVCWLQSVYRMYMLCVNFNLMLKILKAIKVSFETLLLFLVIHSNYYSMWYEMHNL